ncbi:glycosyltransferase [Aquiflexum sp. LQ15W]|uniref:glycosyltransferase n=1 Tax=Cognataquiflexum nitidum TaxID=2922272 RepID=UPI001F138693|nr:glycosyltransferase [Cognataquiflexum nitidum]MCH6198788.1 glycosyltransferase [Cognataquiflexum nitidum]
MLTFYLLFGIVYGLLLLLLHKIWKQKRRIFPKFREPELVTILIPYRNEEQKIPTLFGQLSGLSQRPLQLVFINDHSEDAGKKKLDELIESLSDEQLDVFSLEGEGEGKKAALKTGINKAFGGIVLTTDADCFLPKNWVEEMIRPFSDESIKMVAGSVLPKGDIGFFEQFQQIEWASILLVTQAGFHLGSPIMCSAANMAYRKSAFLEVEGYQGNEDFLSGDDEFLLKKMVNKFGPESVVYLQESLVYTQPQGSWKALFSQRIRWASKWKSHKSLSHALASVLPVAVQVAFLLSFSLLFMGIPGMLVFAAVWILKIYFETKVLGNVLRSFGIRPHWIWFLFTGIGHPVYVLVSAFGALFVKFEWKGRYSSGKG